MAYAENPTDVKNEIAKPPSSASSAGTSVTNSFSAVEKHTDPAAGALAVSFKLAMRRLTNGVSIITAVGESGPVGLVATSVTSLAVDPPSLLICVSRASQSHDSIARTGAFCVNLLGTSDQDLSEKFSNPGMRAERFSNPQWLALSSGSHALVSAIANIDCRVVRHVEHASHSIFIGEVLEVRLSEDDGQLPLLYFEGAYAKLHL